MKISAEKGWARVFPSFCTCSSKLTQHIMIYFARNKINWRSFANQADFEPPIFWSVNSPRSLVTETKIWNSASEVWVGRPHTIIDYTYNRRQMQVHKRFWSSCSNPKTWKGVLVFYGKKTMVFYGPFCRSYRTTECDPWRSSDVILLRGRCPSGAGRLPRFLTSSGVVAEHDAMWTTPTRRIATRTTWRGWAPGSPLRRAAPRAGIKISESARATIMT